MRIVRSLKLTITSAALAALLSMPAVAERRPLTLTGRTNVENAIRYLRDMGDPSTAKRLQTALDNGQFRVDKLTGGENAEVDHSTDKLLLVIDRQAVESRRPWVPSKRMDFVKLVSLAKTLGHEQVHMEQSGTYVAYSNVNDKIGDNPAEIQGWSRGFELLDRWSNSYERRANSPQLSRNDQQRLQNLQRAAMVNDLILMDITSFNDNEYGEFRPPYPHRSQAAYERYVRRRGRRLTQQVDALRARLATRQPASSPLPNSGGGRLTSAQRALAKKLPGVWMGDYNWPDGKTIPHLIHIVEKGEFLLGTRLTGDHYAQHTMVVWRVQKSTLAGKGYVKDALWKPPHEMPAKITLLPDGKIRVEVASWPTVVLTRQNITVDKLTTGGR